MSLADLREHFMDQPFEVSLETYSKCNAACTFCPYPTLDRIGTKMPGELIDRLINEMAEWKHRFYFTPFKVSEPLLDKRLHDICKQVNEKIPNARIRIFTNGQALNMKRAEELHDIDNLELWVSLNTHIAEEYEPLMGVKWDTVIRNLDALHETDFRHPVNVLRVGHSYAFAEYVVDRWPRFEPALLKRDSWLGYVDPDAKEIPHTPCPRWFELSIMANGKAALCCMDSTGEYGRGDVNTQTLLEIYNAPWWRERREQMLDRHAVPICQTCTY